MANTETRGIKTRLLALEGGFSPVAGYGPGHYGRLPKDSGWCDSGLIGTVRFSCPPTISPYLSLDDPRRIVSTNAQSDFCVKESLRKTV